MKSVLTRLLVLAAMLATAYGALAAGPAKAPVISYQIGADKTGCAVNWIDGQLEIVGQGFALNKNVMQARSTAYTILLSQAKKAIQGLRVDGAGLLGAALTADDVKKTQAELIAGIVVAHESWDADRGAYTIVGVLNLYGNKGMTYLGAKAALSFKPLELPKDQVVITVPMTRGMTPQATEGPYTGIIVNGDEALLTPCLFPRVMRFDGKELWGPLTLTPAEIISGPVRYAPNLDAALKSGVAGPRPLVLTAEGNGQGCNPVVNGDDVYQLMLQQKRSNIMSRLPIVITLGHKDCFQVIK